MTRTNPDYGREDKDRPTMPAGSEAGKNGGAFRREGPVPGNEDTGADVEEMNKKAEETMLRNVRPEETTD